MSLKYWRYWIFGYDPYLGRLQLTDFQKLKIYFMLQKIRWLQKLFGVNPRSKQSD